MSHVKFESKISTDSSPVGLHPLFQDELVMVSASDTLYTELGLDDCTSMGWHHIVAESQQFWLAGNYYNMVEDMGTGMAKACACSQTRSGKT